LNAAEAAALASALDDPLGFANRSYRAVSIGRVFLEFDRLPLAWRAFVDAVSEAPAYPDAFAYLGITYDRLGDESLAGAHLDRALELDGESAIGLYLRGVYLSRHARWAEARVDLTRAWHLDPENAPVAFALGRVLAEQKEYAAAEEYFGRAIAREPDNFDWQLALAELYVGRLIRLADRGVPAAQRAVDLDPDSAQAHDWLGWGLHLLGDAARAEFELRVAVDLDPRLARARLHLGNLLIDAGRIEEGRTELFRAADLDPRGEVGARARQLLGEP
jgi:tetratricopeptide (TPR) repeat protein